MFSFLLLLLSAQFSLVFINILFICLSFFVVWANQLDQHAIVIKSQCGQFWLSQAAFSFVRNSCHLFLWCKVMRIYFHCFNEWPHSINSLAPFESAYLLASITLIFVGLIAQGSKELFRWIMSFCLQPKRKSNGHLNILSDQNEHNF